MDFYISKACKAEYDKLLKNSKKYGCLPNSIYLLFADKSIEEISIIGSHLAGNSEITSIRKNRAKSCGNNGKSSGFRILIIVNKLKKQVGVFVIYPKWGTLNKENVKKNEWKSSLTSYKDDLKENKLIQFKLDKDNKTIKFYSL